MLIYTLLATQLVGCASGGKHVAQLIPDSKLVQISILTTTSNVVKIPPKSRIVISNIAGECALELKNALARRLVDNANYEVLTRDNLEQLMIEADRNWAGRFNSETAVRLGELLGASMFIVGQVVYCGPSGGPSAYDFGSKSYHFRSERTAGAYDIFAVLQIINPATGKVVMSSANEGKYIPGTESLLFSADPKDYQPAVSDLPSAASTAQATPKTKKPSAARALFHSVKKKVGDTVASSLAPNPQGGKNEEEKKNPEETVNYPAFKAAEDLANGFADKFFSRPTWEKVEMWDSNYWKFGSVLHYVKLGHCEMGLEFFEELAEPEVSNMPAKDVAEYLHNYGVVLLCANQPEKAIEKLRSAYRINYDQATLRMLGLAAKVTEWSLTVEVDRQPEMDLLVNRDE